MENMTKLVIGILLAFLIVVIVLFAFLIPFVFLDDDDDNSVAATMTTVMTTVTTTISNVFYDAVFDHPVPYLSDFADNTTAAFGVVRDNVTATIDAIVTANSLTAAIPSYSVRSLAPVAGNPAQTEVTVRVETNPTLVDKTTLQTTLTASFAIYAPTSTFKALNDV